MDQGGARGISTSGGRKHPLSIIMAPHLSGLGSHDLGTAVLGALGEGVDHVIGQAVARGGLGAAQGVE